MVFPRQNDVFTPPGGDVIDSSTTEICVVAVCGWDWSVVSDGHGMMDTTHPVVS